MEKNKYEQIRDYYKPETVKFLFIGESRPISGKFFYIDNTQLYNQTKETFELLISDFSREKFKELGCWLYDVCSEPVNQYNENISEEREIKRNIIYNNLPQLKNTIKELKPEYIIIVKKGLFGKVVYSGIISKDINTQIFNIPFPACGNQKKYREELFTILKGKING